MEAQRTEDPAPRQERAYPIERGAQDPYLVRRLAAADVMALEQRPYANKAVPNGPKDGER